MIEDIWEEGVKTQVWPGAAHPHDIVREQDIFVLCLQHGMACVTLPKRWLHTYTMMGAVSAPMARVLELTLECHPQETQISG